MIWGRDDRASDPPKSNLHRFCAWRQAGGDRCCRHLKRVTLELGGNDAAIVLDDVDVEDVAAKLVGLAFFNTGQACVLPKRIYIDDSIYDDMVDVCAVVAAASKVGPPTCHQPAGSAVDETSV